MRNRNRLTSLLHSIALVFRQTPLRKFVSLCVALAAIPVNVWAATPPDFELKNRQWEQLVIPADASGTTVRSMFADDLPAQQYGITWVLFLFDGQGQQYINPGIDGQLPQGAGFWMTQQTGVDVTLDLPSMPDPTVQQSAACPSSAGCTVAALSARSGQSTYSMLGSALASSPATADLRLRTQGAGTSCSAGCSLGDAAELGYIDSELWRYDPVSNSYTNLADLGSISAWQAAWMQTRPALNGNNPDLLFPAESAPVGGDTCMPAPPLPPVSQSDPGKTVINVGNESELQSALSNLSSDTVLLLAPGTYQLSRTLWIRESNVTIRGNSNRCDEVNLVGPGMENAGGLANVPHGIWTASNNLKIQNLTIRDVYYHPVAINPTAQSPQIYNVRMLDAGEQFVKVSSSPTGNGSNNGRVEYSVMKYTAAPPVTDHGGGTGYTNGVDVHNGENWVIRNNLFENFHTPDNAQHLWNPAILMWNGAANTLVENNVFINVDRAIAFGLVNRPNDHRGGIIRNNMIVLRENLFSAQRRANSDGQIILWSSPNTQVLHNTIATQGNTNRSIELRFDSNGSQVRNNLIDAPIGDRSNNSFAESNNASFTNTAIFRDVVNGDLHLESPVNGIVNSAPVLSSATLDVDGQSRNDNATSDIGADEYRP